jgi:hypothetical protein
MAAIDVRPPGPAAVTMPTGLHLGLFGNLQRVVDFDSEVSDGTTIVANLRVPLAALTPRTGACRSCGAGYAPRIAAGRRYPRILLRNARDRSCRALAKNSPGGACSMIWPS